MYGPGGWHVVMDDDSIANGSTQISWHSSSRVALVRYTSGAHLAASDGVFLVDAPTTWLGASGTPFAILADANGLRETDAPCRSRVSKFFKQHRDTAVIALVNLGPVIHIVVEMFRLGTGIQLKTFESEPAARSWLRARGIAA